MKKVYEIIELELENDLIDNLVVHGLEKIKNDRQALIEYAINDVLICIVEHEDEFKKIAKKYKKGK